MSWKVPTLPATKVRRIFTQIWQWLITLGGLAELVALLVPVLGGTLSEHVDALYPTGLVAFAITILVWLLYHWGIGRNMPLSWIDGGFALVGVAYWYVSLRWPLDPAILK